MLSGSEGSDFLDDKPEWACDLMGRATQNHMLSSKNMVWDPGHLSRCPLSSPQLQDQIRTGPCEAKPLTGVGVGGRAERVLLGSVTKGAGSDPELCPQDEGWNES